MKISLLSPSCAGRAAAEQHLSALLLFGGNYSITFDGPVIQDVWLARIGQFSTAPSAQHALMHTSLLAFAGLPSRMVFLGATWQIRQFY